VNEVCQWKDCVGYLYPRRLSSNCRRFGTHYRFHLHRQVNEAAEEARQETVRILKNSSRPRDNLKRTERAALKTLKNNVNLTILPADKGNATVRYFIHLPMKIEPIVSSETSAIRTQTPGNYPKRNNLHLENGESLRTRFTINNFSQNMLVQIPTYTEIQQVDHNPSQSISRFTRPNLSESKCSK